MAVGRMQDQIGRVLGDRYRLIASVGAGASAMVFLADDVSLKRHVAVKLLHQGLSDDRRFVERFRAEAQTTASLSHPHLVAIHDWGFDDEPYLVTEYLAGGSLRSLLDAGHRLTLSQALMVGLEAARGLEHAHRRGLIHRDIKPSNLLFDAEGRLRIADFGLARALAESSITEPTGALLGTARYASPEQAHGAVIDGRSDLYSLAVTLIEAVTGSTPFDADTRIGTLLARSDEALPVPEELGVLAGPLARCGRVEPGERPDAGEFAVALLASAEMLPRPEPLPLMGAADTDSVVDQTDLGFNPTIAPLDVPDGPAATTTMPVVSPASTGVDGAQTLRLKRNRDNDSATGRHEATRPPVPPEEPDADLPWWPWAVLALIVAAAVGIGAWFAWGSAGTATHQVPALVGVQFDDIGPRIGEFGWQVTRLEGREDDSEVGAIIDQDPRAGIELAEGEELRLTVSLGNAMVEVPTGLAGLPIEEATARLAAVGLSLGEVITENSEDVAIGSVIRIADPTGQKPLGEPVGLVVSGGPVARIVPADLVGLPVDDAAEELAALRLIPVEERRFDPDIEVDLVIEVLPAGGSEVAADSDVRLIVSDGPPPVEIPELIGSTLAEATDALQELGLVVADSEGPPGNPVVNTRPAAGEVVDFGSEIVILLREDEDEEEDG